MFSKYDLDKIKFATDSPTFQKAVGLYERGCVTEFKNQFDGYFAVVIGSSPYQVFVSSRIFDIGNCTCYLGVNDTLCKHMIAVAIYAVKNGKILTDEDKLQRNQLIFSGRAGNLTKTELLSFKKELTGAVRYIKPYLGPSRIWFSYQNSLEEGCNRLSALLSELPAGKQTAQLTVDLLLRLDKKLSSGGVDDSDGTVGGFIEEAVKMLLEFAKIDAECNKEFKRLKGIETSFGWEEPLLEIL
ncbi:MAG: hypothetical protein AAB609_01840 [Patescibacteria group bacterium]